MASPNRYTSFLNANTTSNYIIVDAPYYFSYSLFRYRVYGGHSGGSLSYTVWSGNILSYSDTLGGAYTNIAENCYNSAGAPELFAVPPLSNSGAGYYYLKMFAPDGSGLGVNIHSAESRKMNANECAAYAAGWRP